MVTWRSSQALCQEFMNVKENFLEYFQEDEDEEEENTTLPELLSVRSRSPFDDLTLHSRPSPPSVYTHIYGYLYTLYLM